MEELKNPNWNSRFFGLVDTVASWSKDKSMKVGAIIVDSDHNVRSVGYNGFPRGVNDDIESRHERPTKYKFTEHAERNAVYAAARMGTSINECSLYMAWYPCGDCARAIIQAGIIEVYVNGNKWDRDIDLLVLSRPEDIEDEKDSRWLVDFKAAYEMFEEANVCVHIVKF